MLSSVGWRREDLYIANAVKGRPMYGGKSNTLSPNLEEVDACKHYLSRHGSYYTAKIDLGVW